MNRLAPNALLCAALSLPLMSAAQTPSPFGADKPVRPRVGLVLGGGGARGAAHVGVLEVLERLRVPVDCVAGTSMGALVAGAWAAGRSPAQMRAQLAGADWTDMFLDGADYSQQDFHNKRLLQRYLPGSEAGIRDGALVAPPGVVQGQKIKLFFNQLVRADRGEPQIEALPLPISVIATDIVSGQRVVFRDGSLTQAMRASMSVPGLMAPLEYRARKLVDGGLVDNLPVREVRERCGAEVVIAVNVGSPPLRADQVTGLLSITAQVIALLTEQNVSASLAMLTPRDIVIKPELDAITAGDFAKHADAADRGRAAAEAQSQALARLAVDEASYTAWRRKTQLPVPELPRIDEVQVAGLLRVDEALVRRRISQQAGAPLDADALSRDLVRAYGDGHYEGLDYSVRREGTRNLLRIHPVEKSWGPDYLRLGVQLETNLSQGSSFLLRAAYQRTWLNRLGGELLIEGELGSSSGASVEIYQPLLTSQLWFVDAKAEYRRERTDYFFLEQRLAQYRRARARFDLMGGVNLDGLGQLRAGWRQTKVTEDLETGVDVLAAVSERGHGGWLLGLDIDRLDRLYFPRRGWAVKAGWFGAESRDYSRTSLDLRAAWPWRDFVVAGRASWVGSPRGKLPLSEAGRLGGFLNLTGFAHGQLLGDDVGYAHLRAEHIIGRLPLGLRGDMRLGVALEVGHVGIPFTTQRRDGWLNSVALYLGGETPLGPVYIGLGRGSGRSVNAYLFLGTP